MTFVMGGWRRRHSGRYAPLENAGVLRCAQNDDVKLTTATATSTATATAKGKRNCKGKSNSNCKGKSNSNCNCNCKGKSSSWLGDGVRSHLRRIKPRRRWGTQTPLAGLEKATATEQARTPALARATANSSKDKARLLRRSGFVLRFIGFAALDYRTTDWKSGEVRRLANWLSEEE